MKVRVLPWLIAVALVMTGCPVGPDFVRPDTKVNDTWRQAGAEKLAAPPEADARWWKAFNDPVLDSLVESAYRQNLDLQAAGVRVMQARAQLGIATGRIWPQQQQVGASAMYQHIGLNTPSIAADRSFWDMQAGFDAAWELDIWGKYRRGIESEAAGLLATVASYQGALISLTAEVARTYVTIRTFEVLLAQAKQNAEVQQQGLDIAKARLKGGATSELDVAQATTLLESTLATVPQYQASLQQSKNALSTLLGQNVGAVDALLGGSAGGGIPRPPEKVALGLPAELLRRRPDIRAAELSAAAQCARIGMAKADLFPSFSIVGAIGYRYATLGPITGAGPLSNFYYSVGPQIHWPFFNYGRLMNAVRVQDAAFQESLMVYRSTVLKAAQEVEDNLTGFVNNQEALAAQDRSVTSAKRAVEIALAQYREGAVDYQRVLDAERTLLQQQNAQAQTSSSVTTSAIALFKSLGGGWEVRQGEPLIAEPVQEEMHQRTAWGDVLTEPKKVEKKAATQAETVKQ